MAKVEGKSSKDMAEEICELKKKLADTQKELAELKASKNRQNKEQKIKTEKTPSSSSLTKEEEIVIDGKNTVRRRTEVEKSMKKVKEYLDIYSLSEADVEKCIEQRKKTIKVVKEYKEKLDNVCVLTKCGAMAGNGSDLMGNLSALAGAILSFAGIPSGSMFLNSANILQNAGIWIGATSKASEYLFSDKYKRKIREELEKDQRLFKTLEKGLKLTAEIDSEFQKIFGVSSTSKKYNAMTVLMELSKLLSSVPDFDSALDLLRRGKYSVHVGNDVKIENFILFLEVWTGYSKSEELTRSILSFLNKSGDFYKIYNSVEKFSNYICGESSSSLIPNLKNAHEIPTRTEVSCFCIFQAIGLISNYILIQNAQDIIKNGKSKYSDGLENLIKKLENEKKLLGTFNLKKE